MICDPGHDLLYNHHALRASETSKSSIRRQVSLTNKGPDGNVGNVIDIVGMCHSSLIHLRDVELMR